MPFKKLMAIVLVIVALAFLFGCKPEVIEEPLGAVMTPVPNSDLIAAGSGSSTSDYIIEDNTGAALFTVYGDGDVEIHAGSLNLTNDCSIFTNSSGMFARCS